MKTGRGDPFFAPEDRPLNSGTMAIKTVQVADLARAVAFYTHNLGFELLETTDDAATLTAGVDTIRLEPVEQVTPTKLRVWVRDVDTMFPMIVATGTIPPKARVTWQRWGTRDLPVGDLDGNILTLCSASVT